MASKEKFPGLAAIKARAARPPEEKKRPGRPRKNWTAEELAKLPPSQRRIVERRTVAVRTGENTFERAELPPRRGLILTPALIEAIALNVASSAPLKDCAQAAGVSRDTLDEWLRRGADPEEKDPIYRTLSESVARARSQAVVGMAATARSGRKGWQGAAWLLERRHPDDFGPPTKKLEHSGTGAGGAIRITGSVELPVEIPDGHPSLKSAGAPSSGAGKAANGHASLTPRGVAESSSNGHAVPILAEGVSLPPEEDPD